MARSSTTALARTVLGYTVAALGCGRAEFEVRPAIADATIDVDPGVDADVPSDADADAAVDAQVPDALSCATGTADCDGVSGNACEVSLGSVVSHRSLPTPKDQTFRARGRSLLVENCLRCADACGSGKTCIAGGCSARGAWRWDVTFAPLGSGLAVATDDSGNVFGERRSAGGFDGFVVALTSGGEPRWDVGIGAAGEDQAYSVSSTPSGDVVLKGDLWGIADFGGGARTSSGVWDGFALAPVD